MRALLTLCSVLFLALLSTPSYAAEQINDYHVKVYIDKQGGLTVTENIDVRAENVNIKRGIYRDFPLTRTTFLGGALPNKYKIISVKKDGKPEPYHTEKSGNNLRLYIGQHNVFLKKYRSYEYEITYHIPSQVMFFDDYDELYWNAIPTGWMFPILNAKAEFFLPQDSKITAHSVYTGKAFSKKNDAYLKVSDGYLGAKAKNRLEPYHGMTVAFSFPKAVIEPNPEREGLNFFLLQHQGLDLALTCLLILCAFYYFVWDRVGRDPKARPLTPFYDAPANISPAMAGYIFTMGDANTKTLLTATILSLASKGYIKIDEKTKRKYTLIKTKKNLDNGPALSPEERVVYDDIGSQLTISASSEVLISTAAAHNKALRDICHRTYFFSNTGWWMTGFIPLILTMLLPFINPYIPSEEYYIGITILGLLVSLSVFGLLKALEQMRAANVDGFVSGAFIFAFTSMTIIAAIFFISTSILSAVSWLLALCIGLMFGICALMHKLMKAPTRKGRRIMDHIAGLRYYMSAVEQKILKKFDPPQMSRELYEKYLPYAAALDVESKWAKRFAAAIASGLVAETDASARPRWHSPHSSRKNASAGANFSVARMINSIGSAVAGAATSNSSGSSGGGFSGGGGGGGGGGGW